MNRLVYLALCAHYAITASASDLVESPSWIDYNQNAHSNTPWEATLRDFSYAGYHFSNKPLPDISDWQSIDVTDYGALPDDSLFDDAGIRAAIAAADAIDGPVVINFPAGKFLVADEQNAKTPIEINRSYIVLRGAGAQDGGTEIFADWSGGENAAGVPTDGGPWRFIFRPAERSPTVLTQLTANIRKGEHIVTVEDASSLSVGDSVDLVYNDSQSREANFPMLFFNDGWNSSRNKGIRSFEKHVIARIKENQVVFENPIQLNIELSDGYARLETHPHISEVGIEGIRFASDWANHPDTFSHHKNAVVDYAWNAVYLENVRNSWVRDTEFRDWNQCLVVDRSIAVTVKDVEFTGKPGHASFYARYSYGVLFENCSNTASHWHAVGMRWSTTSTVFKNCDLGEMSVDCHGFHPYANLLDNSGNGNFTRNGGAKSAYPNSGPDLTFWSFENAGETRNTYDFWNPTQQPLYTYARPLFIGYSSPGRTVTFVNEGLDELRDQSPYPESLFDAQLQMRRFRAYHSASSAAAEHPPAHANNLDSTTYWRSATPGAGQWLMTDLGVARQVTGVFVELEADTINTLLVEHWDESSWNTSWSGALTGNVQKIYFDQAVDARKLRLSISTMKPGHEAEAAMIRSFKALQTLDTDPNIKLSFETNRESTLAIKLAGGSNSLTAKPRVFESRDLRGWIELDANTSFDLESKVWTREVSPSGEPSFWRASTLFKTN